MVPRFGYSFDSRELRDFEARVHASLRALGDQKVNKQIAVFLEDENRRNALQGLDRYGLPMARWKERHGDSDYHGEDYAAWVNATVLIPFGPRSRRIKDFLVHWERDRFLGFGVGRTVYHIGYTARSGRVPQYWAAHGRDVLGLTPRMQRGTRLILHQHTSKAHGLLKRGGRSVASFVGL